MRRLEICCGDPQSLLAAYYGGADRVELCSALEVGGITPSAGLMDMARRLKLAAMESGRDFRVHILVRPRPGDFLYSESEIITMEADIQAAIDYDADGVVIGALNADGSVDTHTMGRLIKVCGSAVDITYHRAFDLCRDPESALRDIIAIGCHRLLTSGCAPTAEIGIPTIKRLVDATPEGFNIIAGCGVNIGNAVRIIKATGVNEIHASARTLVPSNMTHRSDAVKMGASDHDEYSYSATSQDIVARLAEIIKL